jgi:hypothetical protein
VRVGVGIRQFNPQDRRRIRFMKTLGSLVSIAALAIGMSTVSFAAAQKNEGKFTLTEPATIGSTDLRPGDYKAQWQTQNGNDVKVDIIQHGKVVATTQGQLKTLQTPAPYDAVVTKDNGNSAKAIDEIDFNNRTQALVLGGE